MRPTEIADYGRGPQLTDCRITVYDVIPYWLADRSEGYIAWALGITYEQVLALVQYMRDHNDEVMEVHRKIEERFARGNPPEVEEKLTAGWERMKARLAAAGKTYPEENGDGHPGRS